MNRMKRLLFVILISHLLCSTFYLNAQMRGPSGSATGPGHGAAIKAGLVRHQVNPKEYIRLVELFAHPDLTEINTIKLDWSSRSPVCSGWQVETAGVVEGFQIEIVSHSNSGYKHYGIVRYPLNYTPGGSYPILLFNHGGMDGIQYEVIQFFDENIVPGDFLQNNFFFVAPSYRSELCEVRQLGTYYSEGDPSILDYDVDDVMALLDGVIANIPEADGDRVASYGYSRGGALSLLLGCRDDRVDVLCDLYGPTNWMTPELQQGAEALINQQQDHAGQGLLLQLVMNHAVTPYYVEGTMTLAEARLELIRRSPVFFADMLTDVEFHHGTEDNVVPVEHSDELDEALFSLGSAAPYFSYFRYPGGVHNAPSLPGCGASVESFISGIY